MNSTKTNPPEPLNHESPSRDSAAKSSVLPTPSEMIAYLDRYVQGQERAKQLLSRAVYFHYLNLADGPGSPEGGAPEHCLILGPTGSGKTIMMKRLAELLNVPIFYINAATLTAEGYVGESIGDAMLRFSRWCKSPRKMERAIIFLDEVDKICSHSDHVDVRGGMVQQELLSLLDGNILTFSSKRHDDFVSINTKKLLFIGCGAFDGIEKIASSRIGEFGFRAKEAGRSRDRQGGVEVVAEDIVSFGFIPEFVARFSNIVQLKKLDVTDLIGILKNRDQSPISYHQRMFALHNIELSLHDSAFEQIANKSILQKQGARALRRNVAECLDLFSWRLPELIDERVREIIVQYREGDTGALGYEAEFKYQKDGEEIEVAPVSILRQRVFEIEGENRYEAEREQVSLGSVGSGLGEVAAQPSADSSEASHSSKRLTNTSGWTDDQIAARLEEVKREIRYDETEGRARKWWHSFEHENKTRTALVLRTAEEISWRKSTITEFFLAYVYSNTINIQANLHFLDFRKPKKQFIKGERFRYSPGIFKGSGASREQARRLIRYEEGEPRAKLVWKQIEYEVGKSEEALMAAAFSLTGAGIGSLDSLLEVAIRSGVYSPDAVAAFYNFWKLYSREKVAQIPEAILPFWNDILARLPERSQDPIVVKCSFFKRIVEGVFWERFSANAEIDKDFSGSSLVNERLLSSQFFDESPKKRVIQGVRFASDWREEMFSWLEALSAFPGLLDGSVALSLIEGIVAELSPLLICDSSWVTEKGIKNICERLSSKMYYLVMPESTIEFLMLYTGDELNAQWSALIPDLSEEQKGWGDIWSRVQARERIVALFEPRILWEAD